MTETLFPELDWEFVDVAVERVKLAWQFHQHMNLDGTPMHLAFSGGKDSICLFFVCKRASEELGLPMEQMFSIEYNVAGIDPPELVYFIRDFKKTYPFIKLNFPRKTMWQLIVDNKKPPTRMARYCCAKLKESATLKNGYNLTGVRRAESVKRSGKRGFKVRSSSKKSVILLNDNGDERNVNEYCMQKKAYICNPIIDWSEDDVWAFIRHNNLPYCKLYDEGFKRLGCIGCPLASVDARKRGLDRYPNIH